MVFRRVASRAHANCSQREPDHSLTYIMSSVSLVRESIRRWLTVALFLRFVSLTNLDGREDESSLSGNCNSTSDEHTHFGCSELARQAPLKVRKES